MVQLALFNFILFNFRQALVTSGLIFHCWEAPASRIFAQWAVNEGLYMQYVNIDHQLSFNLEFYANLKEHFFKHERPLMGVFFDLNCANSHALLNASSFHYLFSEYYHWILLEGSGNIEPFRQFAEHANLLVCSDVTLVLAEHPFIEKVRNDSDESRFTLWDVYNNGPHIGGKLNFTVDRSIVCTIADCKLERYLSFLHARPRYGNRNNQSDITMRIATVITNQPNTTFEEKIKFLMSEEHVSVDPLIRFGFRQSLIIMETLYAKHSVSFFASWSTGTVFGGSLSAILNGSSDLCSTPFTMSNDRSYYFQVLTETGSFHTVLLFRTQRQVGLAKSGHAFLEPFSPIVWIAFAIILIISAIQLWTMFFIEYYRLPKKLNHLPSLLTTFLITLGTACIQGAYVMPNTVGGRATYTVLALCTFLLYNYYTSIIVSTLLDKPAKSDLKTVGQVADSSLKVGFEPRPWLYSYLNNSQEPGLRRLVRNKIEKRKNPLEAWMPVEEGILRVRDEIGTFAYGLETSSGIGLIEEQYKPEEICDLNEVLLRPESSIANHLPKNSSFKELFRLRVLRLMETGVNRRLSEYWQRVHANCFPSNTIVEVGLGDTAPLFLLMTVSFVVCIFVLSLEVVHNRRKRNQEMRE